MKATSHSETALPSYLEEAKFIGTLVWPHDDGLDVADVYIATSNSDGYAFRRLVFLMPLFMRKETNQDQSLFEYH